MTTTHKPLYERTEAPTDRVTDLVLLLLAAADDATIASVRGQLAELDVSAFLVDVDVNDEPEPRESLELLDSLGYLATRVWHPPERVDEDAPIELTERGAAGAAALQAGLDDDQRAALDEVIA